MFNATTDHADDRAFAERCADNRTAFVRFHVRRPEALARQAMSNASMPTIGRCPGTSWSAAKATISAKAASAFGSHALDARSKRQVGSDGTTWLGRDLLAGTPTPLSQVGFGRDVRQARYREPVGWSKWEFATADGKTISIPPKALAVSNPGFDSPTVECRIR